MKEFFNYITPEKAGISSKNVIKFMDELEHYGVYLHGFALVKGHDVFAEAYRAPFKKGELHRLYSVSKTFTSMAMGCLIGEGKAKLTDTVISFFPEYDEKVTDPYVRNITIEDCLLMATAFSYGTTYSAKRPAYLEPDWVHTFFNVDTSHPSGTVWNYDTSGSYMIGVIVEKVTGKPFIEYLKEKALLEIGCSKDITCLKAPEGYAWGGSAVLASTLDLARFARLVMDMGEWNGKQLLPRDYVEAAISKKIDNGQEGFFTFTEGHGYGYQIWRTLDNTFSFLGMGGQLAICMPEEDLLFVCNADVQGLPGTYAPVYMCLWKNIKELINGSPLAEDKAAFDALSEKCSSIEYPCYPGNKTSEVAQYINGKKYILNKNPMGITEIAFCFDDDGNAVMKYTNAQGSKELKFGIGKTVIDKFPQDGYFGDTIGKDSGRRYRCISSGAWTTETTLHIKSDIIDDYFGNVSIIATFKGDEIGIYMQPHAEWFLGEYNGFAGGKIAE